MEIGQIVNGHINEILGLNKDLQQERLNICYMCPLYSPKLGGICNRKLYLNPNTGDVSIRPKNGYVNGCGCKINFKVNKPNNSCPIGKW